MIVDANTVERNAVIERIAELEHELFDVGAWSTAAIAQELDAPARVYLLDVTPQTTSSAESPAAVSPTPTIPTIRGYAGYWYDGDDAELMTIGVGTDYQHHGIATALLTALIERARAQGAHRMLLEVRVDNNAALTLYQNAGFTRIGVRKRYYQPGNIDAYTMALDLTMRIVGFTPTHTEKSTRKTSTYTNTNIHINANADTDTDTDTNTVINAPSASSTTEQTRNITNTNTTQGEQR